MNDDILKLCYTRIVRMRDYALRVTLNTEKDSQPYKDGTAILETADMVLEILLASKKEPSRHDAHLGATEKG